MDPGTLAGFAGVIAFALAYSIGANDAANALGTSVGSKALKYKTAVLMGAAMEFLGTITLGGFVSSTMAKEITSPRNFEDSPHQRDLFVVGMFSAMLSATVILLAATVMSLPVSTTQTIVGGIAGFGFYAKGPDAINWSKIGAIGISWFATPILGAVMGFALYSSIHHFIMKQPNPVHRAIIYMPYYTAGSIGIIGGFLTFSQWQIFKFPAWIIAVVTIVLFVTSLAFAIVKLAPHYQEVLAVKAPFSNFAQQQAAAQEPFWGLLVLSAAAVAFAHGANDVANAIGPFDAIVEYALHDCLPGGEGCSSSIPIWILIMGGVGITIGLLTFGQRVIETVGSKITKLTYSKGYAAQISASFTVMVASLLALPVSTTSTLVGAIVGVGYVKTSSSSDITLRDERAIDSEHGLDAGSVTVPDDTSEESHLSPSSRPSLSGVDKVMVAKIASGWIMTVVLGAGVSIIFYMIISNLI